MTRLSYQRGYVSDPIHTRRGVAFRIRYRVRTMEGKWKHKSEMLYDLGGKKAAKAVLAQRIKESSVKRHEVAELTFQDFVATYWNDHLERNRVKPSTRQSYQCLLDRHILPALGEVPLTEFSPLHLDDLLARKREAGFSPKTLRNMVMLLQGIFSLAVDKDLIGRSPVRESHKPVVFAKEKPAWTAEQVRSIIMSVADRYRALFFCAALTGARLGELLGLQCKHIDFQPKTLRIEQSLWQGQLVTPKTAKSARTIRFGEVLAQVLVDHFQNSAHIGPDDFVFCKADGSPLHPDVLRKDVLYPTLDRLGIERRRHASGFHAFRHSAASFVNARTGNLKLAQGLLGHSNLSTTADTYTHTFEESEREAAMAVEAAIFGEKLENLFPTVPKTGNRNSGLVVN